MIDKATVVTVRLLVVGSGTPEQMASDIIDNLDNYGHFTEVLENDVWRETALVTAECISIDDDLSDEDLDALKKSSNWTHLADDWYKPEWAKEDALVATLVDDKDGKLKFYCAVINGGYSTGVEYNRDRRVDYGATQFHHAAVSAVRTVTQGLMKAREEGWK